MTPDVRRHPTPSAAPVLWAKRGHPLQLTGPPGQGQGESRMETKGPRCGMQMLYALPHLYHTGTRLQSSRVRTKSSLVTLP